VYSIAALEGDHRTRLHIERHALALRSAQHPNIIRTFPAFRTTSDLYTVEEYCLGGELFELLDSQLTSEVGDGSGLPVKIVRRLIREVLEGVYYIHHVIRVCHRDLKLENIFLDADNRVKIASFGMAAPVAAPGGANIVSLSVPCGSRHYAPPEVAEGHPYDGCAFDVWSCGVMLFALLTGSFPFDDSDPASPPLFEQARRADTTLGHSGLLKSVTDRDAVDLVLQMLRVDPVQRITVARALDHPFFTKAAAI
jgi:serine/threonine protein kinase